MESLELADAKHTIEDASKLRTISFDAVDHLLHCRI